mmetsp:Transcript_31701/g.80043  ORF Transcript_31701/g.80043 Transcript_31701/m.80043 type:complete len:90 (-) Transcript_31701:434-703(-)
MAIPICNGFPHSPAKLFERDDPNGEATLFGRVVGGVVGIFRERGGEPGDSTLFFTGGGVSARPLGGVLGDMGESATGEVTPGHGDGASS